MKRFFILWGFAVLFLLLIGFGRADAGIQNTDKAIVSSSIDEQTGVAVTVYNVNLGLVKDRRKIKLFSGEGEVRFMDVASQILPSSVHVKSLAGRETLQVIEQNYEFDLLNPQKLLDKYVGKEVKLYYKNPYSEREETIHATLLSNAGGPIFRIGDEITFGHPGRIIFPEVPGDLILRPTLVWLVRSSIASAQTVEASFLTNGINWRADYVITLNESDERADISGWITIDNRSGATYRNATLKLVAGDVRRVRDEFEYRDNMLRAAETAVKADAQFKREEFFEYHIYSLGRPSTIRDNQTKQIGLVNAGMIPVRKELVFDGSAYYYHNRHGEAITDQKIRVIVEFDNRKEHNLGVPLPGGIVRAYKLDADGGLQFAGEDSISHAPEDEKIRVHLGNAFDVVGSRKQTDWKKIAADTYEAGFEISLGNRKKEDVVVKVVEPIPGDWMMLSSSHEYRKTKSFTAEFDIPVKRDGESILTYRVRMRF